MRSFRNLDQFFRSLRFVLDWRRRLRQFSRKRGLWHEYGVKYHADFSRWHFLASPSRAAVFSLARALHVTDQTDDRNYQILHSDNFLLVDGQGKVRGVYDSNNSDAVARLRADAVNLLPK